MPPRSDQNKMNVLDSLESRRSDKERV